MDAGEEKSAMRIKLGVTPFGASLPVVRKAFISLTTKETDTLKCAAAA